MVGAEDAGKTMSCTYGKATTILICLNIVLHSIVKSQLFHCISLTLWIRLLYHMAKETPPHSLKGSN